MGGKSFGENNGRVYAKRFRQDYFKQRVETEGGERLLDMMGMVTDCGLVRVFTPDHRFISADGKHLTAAGAGFYAERIEWGRWLEMGDRE